MPAKKRITDAHMVARPAGLAYLIGRLDHVLNKRLAARFASLQLTVPQYTALSVFQALGSLSNAQLAERTMVSPQAANEMVKAMEARGWIERQPDPSHGRIIRISLTEYGKQVLKECDARVRELEHVMFGELTDDEQAGLQARLRVAVRALSVPAMADHVPPCDRYAKVPAAPPAL